MADNVFSENYYAFTAVTVGTNNVSPFTAYNSATIAVLTFEGSAVRARLDGVSAHSASGHLYTASQIAILRGADVIKSANFICTNTTGTIMASIGAK